MHHGGLSRGLYAEYVNFPTFIKYIAHRFLTVVVHLDIQGCLSFINVEKYIVGHFKRKSTLVRTVRITQSAGSLVTQQNYLKGLVGHVLRFTGLKRECF